MFKAFRSFLLRGNVLELAVAFILGAAFTSVVQSFANDLLTPPVSALVGDLDFTEYFVVLRDSAGGGPYPSVTAAKAAGAVTLNYGLFITKVVSFAITALALFFVIRAATNMKRREEVAPAPATTRACPYCAMNVSLKATRCPFCTSELKPV